MQQSCNIAFGLSLIAVAVISSSSASAAALDFDCDAASDHTSSVSQIALSPDLSVSGSLSIVGKRSGHFLPLAGILISPAEKSPNSDFVGFQIVATRDGNETSNITLRDHGSNEVIKNIATIADSKTEQFSLSLSISGNMILSINEKVYTISVPRTEKWSNLRVEAICSTGHFRFSELDIISKEGGGG